MKKFLLLLCASGTALAATPAAAVVTLATTNGTPLASQIFGIKSTGNPVYGSSPNNTNIPNVTYTADTITTMDIKSGGAQINDANGGNSKSASPSWSMLIINPDLDFSAMKFALQTTSAGNVDVLYLLTGSGLDPNLFSSYTSQCATCSFSSDNKSDDKYLINGATFDGIMLRMAGGNALVAPATMFEFKTNSYDLAQPSNVPEPATWALMLLGFGGVGYSMRRRRKAVIQQMV